MGTLFFIQSIFINNLIFKQMNKNSAAQKAQNDDSTKNHLHVVKPGATPEKVSKLQEHAEDVQAEAIDQEQPKEATAIAAEQPTETKPIAPQTIEDIKRKAELLTRLSGKYDDLIEKRKRMENFVVSHDNDTANIILHDARGESFTSTNPTAIAQFIEFCKVGFSEAIQKIETQMREIA